MCSHFFLLFPSILTVTATGSNKAYEENVWCVEYGHRESDDGVSANEACCACGGGIDYEEPEL